MGLNLVDRGEAKGEGGGSNLNFNTTVSCICSIVKSKSTTYYIITRAPIDKSKRGDFGQLRAHFLVTTILLRIYGGVSAAMQGD